ncbi:MAG: HIT domain-containing protein [Candidatus Paceibacterota bacterium]
MKHVDSLKKIKVCPFCNFKNDRILFENKTAFLTYSLAPYHKYHLLVIPKRHVEYLKDLTPEENIDTMLLFVSAIKSLDKIGHNDCTIVMRDGKSLGKSVKHLHYNIIPGGEIGDFSINAKARKLLTKKEEDSLTKELKKIIKI